MEVTPGEHQDTRSLIDFVRGGIFRAQNSEGDREGPCLQYLIVTIYTFFKFFYLFRCKWSFIFVIWMIRVFSLILKRMNFKNIWRDRPYVFLYVLYQNKTYLITRQKFSLLWKGNLWKRYFLFLIRMSHQVRTAKYII